MAHQNKTILMVGPDINGLGGISKVISNWLSNGFFFECSVRYFPTTTIVAGNKHVFFIRSLARFAYAVRHDCRCVYIHTSSGNGFFRKSFYILMSYLFKRKVILHIHPFHFYDFITSAPLLVKTYILFILRHVSSFIVLTNRMKELILELFPNKPCFVLGNPICLEQIAQNNNSSRMKNSILFLGSFIKEKGIYDLVDAVEILVKERGYSTIQLNFFGSKNIDKLTGYVTKKNLGSHITVNDFINSEQVIQQLYKHTVLILPSYSEGIPNVILEAMATKTPIIATAVGGLKEILKDRINSIITEVGNPKDLSDKIMICFNDKALMEAIAETAYREVHDFDVSVIKEKFRKILFAVASDFQKDAMTATT